VWGAIFVPTSKAGLLVRALAAEPLPAAPSLDEVLQLMAHVPARRWPALADHLALMADAAWFPKGATVVDDATRPEQGVVVHARGRRVRITPNDTIQGRALVERLRG
jgi:hypothetical protein